MLRLDVFLESQTAPAGALIRADDGALSFQYLTDDLPHPVSLSLPVQEAPFGDVRTRAFFANLLFENTMRDQVMQRHRIDQNDIAGLLYHLGQDCPGALSVVPQGTAPGKRPGHLDTDYVALSDDDLITLMTSLRDVRRLPNSAGDPSPLAGVQAKVALTQLPDGRFALPKPGTGAPTTHILKVPRVQDMQMVPHEHIVMGIMAAQMAHPVAETTMIGTGDLRALLIKRFDRRIEGTAVHRMHQEDFCQALGLGPALKYQRDGTDSAVFSAQAAGTVLAACATPAQARVAFFEASLLNILLGNTDNHAKNHALLYDNDPRGRPIFAPLYDVVPTMLDGTVTHQMSFDIGGAQMAEDITGPDLEDFARALGYRRLTAAMKRRITALIENVTAEIPGLGGPERKRIGDVIAQNANTLAAALNAPIDIPEWDLVPVNRP
ncbi:HipA domain-containing protein [Cognatishimia sp. SS12]|uniref:HipA domain-containing protein n=1 Tax=Cognatishimia sp. SS12 TaxID=2979465 RepID=UPI00232D6910|nr:HipA domain-containing protein [Cognatishimia sp. SS12]MDC0739692.1 HipA domain-containing protein [Cognatishimia sp. SS12]